MLTNQQQAPTIKINIKIRRKAHEIGKFIAAGLSPLTFHSEMKKKIERDLFYLTLQIESHSILMTYCNAIYYFNFLRVNFEHVDLLDCI